MLKMPSVARTAFTQLEKGIARLAARNGIHNFPEVHVSGKSFLGSSPAALIHTAEGPPQLHVSEHLARLGDTPVAIGAVAHEAGHLLAKHPVAIGFGGVFCDTQNPHLSVIMFSNPFKAPRLAEKVQGIRTEYGKIKEFNKHQKALWARYKGQEQEADQLMTHFLGSHEDALTLRRTLTLGSELVPYAEIPLLSTTAIGRVLNPVSHAVQRKSFKKLYGTAKELERNIQGVNLEDRSHVEKLIERWNSESEHSR